MSLQELLRVSSLDQARLIAAREVSCEELVGMYLERIERLNPRLQAFVEVYCDDAVREARQKDAMARDAKARGVRLPPFHGVPIGIKDLNLVRGKRTRFGSAGSLGLVSPVDDLTVAPLRRAGFVILGKLATSELGATPVTEPDIHEPTRNPWNPAFSSGGSSGGSGTAVAAGMLPVAQGSDGGGSIRIPSSFCGLFGLKPARGRVPNQFGWPDHHILYTSGALTRTVDESAALLDVLAGLSEGEPHWATPPEKPFAELARREPGRLRVRFSIDSAIVKTDPEVREAVLATAKLLGDLGHEVEEAASPRIEMEEFLPLWRFQIASMPLMRWSRVQPMTRLLREEGRHLKARDVHALHLVLERKLLDWFDGADVWLTPTVPLLPPRVGEFRGPGDPRALFYRIAELGAFTAICNASGQPAMSVPSGLSRSGLPIGTHFIGPLQGEAVLFQLARQLERARPWPLLAPMS